MSIGFSNIVSHQCSIALGYSVNSDCENTVFVNNLCANDLIRARKLNVGLTQTFTDSERSSIVGGANNMMTSSNCSTLAGGRLNTISASNHQFIGAGCKNTGSADHAFIGSGFKNSIESAGSCSGIVGGCCNTVQHANSFIVGSKLATDAACTTYVNNLHVKGPQVGETVIILESLPELDPGNAGQLYNDNGILKISLG